MKIFLNELNEEMQNSLALEVSRIIKKSPLFTPTMPIWGTPFKTKITNAGDWGSSKTELIHVLPVLVQYKY